jgi:hypothetical protein
LLDGYSKADNACLTAVCHGSLVYSFVNEYARFCMYCSALRRCCGVVLVSVAPQEHLNEADALYYHVPSFSGAPIAKRHPNQLRLAMSLESASYYHLLDSSHFMCQFDAEMTYRQCAQVGCRNAGIQIGFACGV